MEMATVQLGGHPMYIKPEELGIDSRETAEDVVRVMAGYHSVLAARVFDHDRLERMAAAGARCRSSICCRTALTQCRR